MVVPTQDLPGGYKIPVVGYGTAGRGGIESALELALEAGYRHIDTAYAYRNEEEIGKVLNKWLSTGKVKREELFIVTKLPSSANTSDRVEEFLKKSLKSLQLDYVDLYLIHHPIWREPKDPNERFGESIAYPTDHIALWKKMEEQVDAGRTKTIGLSNFNSAQIDRILKIARIKPASLQIENHLYLQQNELVKFCQDNGIVVVAYSPLGAPGRSEYREDSGLPKTVLLDATVLKLAEKYNKTPAQILLKFQLQRNVVVIPKSSTPQRIKENFDLFSFTLTDQDFNTLRSLDIGEKARLGFGAPKGTLQDHPEWPFPKGDTYYVVNRMPPRRP